MKKNCVMETVDSKNQEPQENAINENPTPTETIQQTMECQLQKPG